MLKEIDKAHPRVFVSGCYDMLHSGHVAFFRTAAAYGDLYVGIGSDDTIFELKKRKTIYSEKERLYMVKAIRYVTDAFINRGSGYLDFVETVEHVKPDYFVVNSDGGSEDKKRFCAERGIKYIELNRIPDDDMIARSTTDLRKADICGLPYRLDLAGTWIDQPYVSCFHPGWALTISLEPIEEYMERGGMSTSTRNTARRIWPYELPAGNEEVLARMVFCFENDPENAKGHISGAQDSIGICMSGLNRHYYDNCYWPARIESCHDEETLAWLEDHLCLVPMFPRRPGCSVVEGKDITPEKVANLTDAASRCWDAIMNRDLQAFAKAFADSFEAQISMFPAMIQPGVQDYIDKYAPLSLAHKLSGAGGGGYLALVIDGPLPQGAHPIKIRRRD